jgi:hypothetical protein
MVTKSQKKAEVPPFVGEENGVTAAMLADGSFAVSFPFDRQLHTVMRGVPGADFDKQEELYTVPATSKDDLSKALQAIRQGAHFIAESLAGIEGLARGRGFDAQRANGAEHTVQAQVSDFIEPGRHYGGEILAVNAHYAAQLNGFGKDDGAAFVSIHRLANLEKADLLKGDKVAIKYDNRFIGAVGDLAKSADELTAEFEATKGKLIDGVTATDRGAMIGVKFDLNPAMLARIRRIDGAAFNRDDGLWEAPAANKPFVLKAVQDMRREHVIAERDAGALRVIAESKMDGAKVSHAFTKDNFEHFGKVIAVGERYVLQKGGKDSFALHHLAALDTKPEVGQSLAIKYNRGMGTVVDQEQKRATDKALANGR